MSLIWVSKNNEIIDGHHRYTILLNKFGGNYEITVRQFNLANAAVAEYNIAEYNIGEYGGTAFDNKIINIGGSGKVIQLGFETSVFNKSISIQKLDVYVKTGKTR